MAEISNLAEFKGRLAQTVEEVEQEVSLFSDNLGYTEVAENVPAVFDEKLTALLDNTEAATRESEHAREAIAQAFDRVTAVQERLLEKVKTGAEGTPVAVPDAPPASTPLPADPPAHEPPSADATATPEAGADSVEEALEKFQKQLSAVQAEIDTATAPLPEGALPQQITRQQMAAARAYAALHLLQQDPLYESMPAEQRGKLAAVEPKLSDVLSESASAEVPEEALGVAKQGLQAQGFQDPAVLEKLAPAFAQGLASQNPEAQNAMQEYMKNIYSNMADKGLPVPERYAQQGDAPQEEQTPAEQQNAEQTPEGQQNATEDPGAQAQMDEQSGYYDPYDSYDPRFDGMGLDRQEGRGFGHTAKVVTEQTWNTGKEVLGAASAVAHDAGGGDLLEDMFRLTNLGAQPGGGGVPAAPPMTAGRGGMRR